MNEKKHRKIMLTTICLLLIACITILVPLLTIGIIYTKGSISMTIVVISFIIAIILDIAIGIFFNWRIKSI